MGKVTGAVRYLLEHQAALTISALTALLTFLIGKLGLDLDGGAIALAIIAQLSAGLGIRQAVYSKATTTKVAEDAYRAGADRPVPLPGEVVPVPPEVKP